MKRGIITAAVVLGLGGVTFALARQVTTSSKPQPPQAVPSSAQSCNSGESDPSKLHARVAKLRAEVELLQLEHDAIKAMLSDRIQGVEKANAEITGELDQSRVAAFYMRMGAESVGKAIEFDQKARVDRAAVEKATEKATATAGEFQTSLKGKKEEFLRLTTELNEKKIELVELEIKLEGSM